MSDALANDLRVASARFRAIHVCPYLAHALCAMSFVPQPGLGTVAVDAKLRCFIDPAVLNQWDTVGLSTALIHEVWHFLREHHVRAKAMHADDFLFNVGSDCEINDDLVGVSGLKFPVTPLTPKVFHLPDHQLAETYYAELKKQQDKLPQITLGVGAGCCGPCATKQGVGEQEQEHASLPAGISEHRGSLIRRMVAEDIVSHGRSAGQVPMGVRRWATDLLEPPIDPRRLIRDAIRSGIEEVSGCDDYSFKRPNRRQAACGSVILPSLMARIPAITILIDTSGSMSNDMLGLALGVVQKVLRTTGHRQIKVASCDTQIHQRQSIYAPSAITLYGGGGTSMAHGLEEAQKDTPKPDLIILVTDCETPWPSQHPACGFVIINVGHGNPPPWPCKIVNVSHLTDERSIVVNQ